MLDRDLQEQWSIWERDQDAINAFLAAARTVASIFLYAPLVVSTEEDPLSGAIDVIVRDTETAVEMRARVEESAGTYPDVLAAAVTVAALQCAAPLAAAYFARQPQAGGDRHQ